MQPGLLQELEGHQHAQDLEGRGEGHVLLGLDHAQEKPRRQHLLMVEGDRHIERGKEQAEGQGEIAKHGQGGRHEIVVAVVAGDLHEFGEAHRQHQADRQPVDQQADPALQEIQRKAVGPLGVQELRKGRARRVGDGFLHDAGGQEPVDVEGLEARAERGHRFRLGDAVHIEHGQARVGLAADRQLPELEGGRAEPAPHQAGVDPQGLDEGVLGALDGLLEARLAHGAAALVPDLEADGLLDAVEEQRAGAVRQIGHDRVEALAALGRVAVYCAGEDALETLLLVGGGVGAQGIGERAQDLLGHELARDDAVEPAQAQPPLFVEAEEDLALLIVRAVGEERAQRLGAQGAGVFGPGPRMDRPRQAVG